jgi:predicted PurR-regulated permease PerM
MINTLNLPRKKLIVILAIAVGFLILLTLIFAPSQQLSQQGSTYGREPTGYGAWAAFMEKRGTPIQRWQKPLSQLSKKSEKITLLQIQSSLESKNLSQLTILRQWLEKGNRLIFLGILKPVTESPFTTMQQSSFGNIAIDTSRRSKNAKEQLLGDRFGAIVWREKVGQGEIILATTPHLAANAYQDYQSNYQFLADLATKEGYALWVDEYLHGYKDSDVIRSEIGESIWSFFLKTPLLLVLIQFVILIIFLLWSGNRRFAQAIAIIPPTRNNSEAYIQALAGVLEKAESADFVVSRLQKTEQKALQSALGLGTDPLPSNALVTAWEQQHSDSSSKLRSLLEEKNIPKNNEDLRIWLEKWHTIKKQSQT